MEIKIELNIKFLYFYNIYNAWQIDAVYCLGDRKFCSILLMFYIFCNKKNIDYLLNLKKNIESLSYAFIIMIK